MGNKHDFWINICSNNTIFSATNSQTENVGSRTRFLAILNHNQSYSFSGEYINMHIFEKHSLRSKINTLAKVSILASKF